MFTDITNVVHDEMIRAKENANKAPKDSEEEYYYLGKFDAFELVLKLFCA